MMIRAVRVAILLIITTVAWPQTAHSGTQEDMQFCERFDVPPDGKLEACTRVILSEQFSDQEVAIAFMYRGLFYFSENQFDLAIAEYGQAIIRDSNLSNAFLGRGMAYEASDQIEQALADFDQAVHLSPADWGVYYSRGTAYMKNHQFDLAVSDFNHLIRLSPAFSYAYSTRGNAYMKNGQFDLAIADFSHLIRLEPDSLLANSAYSDRGDAYIENGQFKLAIADFTHLIRLGPNIPIPVAKRGLAYEGLGQHVEAIRDYKRAYDLGIGLDFGRRWEVVKQWLIKKLEAAGEL